MLRYFVRWFRTNMASSAELYKYRFSIVYAILAYNVTIYAIHKMIVPDCDITKQEGQKKLINKLVENKTNVEVIKLQGLKTISIEAETTPENLSEEKELL